MRIWISATCLSKSLAMSDWPSNFIQCIFVSTRLRRWYPLQRRHTVRPRYCCALTASLRAIAPALVGFQGLAFLRGGGDFEILAFPIADFSVPVDMMGFHILIEEVARRLLSGQCVIVHCRAGIGRSGLFAASLLTALNMSFDEVLQSVQSAGGKFETEAQRLFLQEYQFYRVDNFSS